jgi:hypothetical protein
MMSGINRVLGWGGVGVVCQVRARVESGRRSGSSFVRVYFINL